VYATNPDFLYWYDGKVIFFRQSGTSNPLMLVTPLIDITDADMLYFDMGEMSGDPVASFGVVTDPMDPSTFTEHMSMNPGAAWETFEFDLTTINGGENEVYFAWQLDGTDFSFFSFDNVIITAGGGNEYCLEGLYMTGCDNGDGIVYWDFADVNVPDIACDGSPYTWYHDHTDMVHHVTAGSDYTLTVEGGYGGEHLYVWVDLDQDYYMDEDEALVSNWALTDPGTPYQTTITIPEDAPLGQFTVRFRTNWSTPIPESCFGVNFGNMADFTIEIAEGTGNEDCEDFDDLTVGGYVAEQLGGSWTTWSGTPGTAEDALVTDAQSFSPDNSFIVDPNVDLVLELADEPLTTGAWLYSHQMYVASGTAGYFNVQSEPTPRVAWVIELFFNVGGAGEAVVDGVTTQFSYPEDAWFWVGVNIDLDSDLGDFWIDDEILFSFPTTNSIGGIDYFGGTADDAAYYDDVCFEEGYIITPPVLNPPSNLTAEVVDEDIVLAWDAPAGPIGTLLCVDRDGSADLEFTDDWQFIQPALDALGIEYTYFEVTDLTGDGPDLATMEQYDVIFWFCGEGWQQDQTMSDNDEANLATYLDGGGNLLLSGHDYLWDRYPSAGNLSSGQFPYDYLGVASAIQDTWFITGTATASASGVSGSFAEGLTFSAIDIYTTDKDGLYIDELVSLDVDLLQVTQPAPTGISAVQFDGGGFRTAFTTVSIAAITEQSAIEDMLSAALSWLSNGDSDELTGYNVYYQYNGGGFDLAATTTDTEFIHEGFATTPGLHEYYVTAVYDEGESEPTNIVDVLISGVTTYSEDGLRLFPNPASSEVHIMGNEDLESVTVYNFAGQITYTQENTSRQYSIDVSKFNPGVYLFRIKTRDRIITKRLVVE
jgi:hypothetical protein